MTPPPRVQATDYGKRRSQIYLRALATAVLARQLCLALGVILAAVGLANLLALLSLDQLVGGSCLLSGIGLLRWVASGPPKAALP